MDIADFIREAGSVQRSTFGGPETDVTLCLTTGAKLRGHVVTDESGAVVSISRRLSASSRYAQPDEELSEISDDGIADFPVHVATQHIVYAHYSEGA